MTGFFYPYNTKMYLLISLLSLSTFTAYPKVETLERQQLVEEAKSHIGAKYSYGGEDIKGFDCSGFTKYIYNKALGLELPHASHLQSEHGKKVKYKSAAEGDLVFFKRKGKINHVGIITKISKNELWVIHSTTSKGVILEDVKKSIYWKSKISSICTYL